jgi:cysteine desulfurase
MAANNEIGVLQPVREIAAAAKKRGVLFHTDATQAVGKIPFDVAAVGADLASFTAHKIYGPKGVGGLYVRRENPRVRLAPILDGGGHEGGLRSGTLNVPGIVGFGTACEIAAKSLKEESARIGRLRDRLMNGILSRLDNVHINGSTRARLAHNLNLSFGWVESESLIKRLEPIAVSSAAACATANPEPSHVLRALGVPEDFIHTAVRFSLGRFTTPKEIDTVIARVVAAVKAVRGLSPLYAMARRGEIEGAVQWKD